MIPPHSPRKVNDGTATVGIMDLLPIRQDEALAAGDAPDEGDVVFFAAAGRAGFAGDEGVGVGEAEAPSDAAFGVGDAFAAGYGGEVYGVEGAIGGGSRCWGGWHGWIDEYLWDQTLSALSRILSPLLSAEHK